MSERVDGLPTWLLSRANARAQGMLVSAFADAGFRGYAYRLMAALAEQGALSQAELGRETGSDRKDVAVAVGELESRALVGREPDPTDARRKVVSLTAAGAVELDRLDGVVSEVQERVLAPLSADERAVLVGLLRRLDPGPPELSEPQRAMTR